MKIKGSWLILACVVVVAGLLVAFGLNRSTQAQHFIAINAVIAVQVG